MEYRVLETTEEFEAAVDVEIAVWGVNPRDSVPSSLIRALTHAGGVAHGAYDEHAMVGMSLAFPALRGSKVILWSHSTGVLPAYQKRDIGFSLKQAQREWALAHGFDEIGWTFDPLRRRNASFNLHRLGATSNLYHVNFYGEMSDLLNAGMPSDRLEACWGLNDPRVVALANHQPAETSALPLQQSNILLTDGSVYPAALAAGSPVLYAEVPANMPGGLGARIWRLAQREALQGAFARGYAAADVLQADERHWYLLRQL